MTLRQVKLIAGCLLWMAAQAQAQSSKAVLEVLQVRVTGGATLSPAFTPDHGEYEVRVNSDIYAIDIRLDAMNRASRLKINTDVVESLAWYHAALNPGPNPFVVNVLAADGKASKDYVVRVYREDAKPITVKFVRAVYSDTVTGLRLHYRLFVPESRDPVKRYPIVMFLHGGGHGGTDNEKQLEGSEGAIVWAKPAEQAKHPAFVLAPQSRDYMDADPKSPIGGFGVSRDKLGDRYMAEALTPSADVQLAVKVLEKVLTEYPSIDRKRVYVTGLSQGGLGAWNAGILRPDLFAAVVPISGGADVTQVSRLANVPVWAFHSEDDPSIPVRYSRDAIAALRKAGGRPIYTEYPSGTYFFPTEHFAWVYAYNNEAMREWLFSQSKH